MSRPTPDTVGGPALLDAAAALLDIPTVPEGASFVELGGDSLRAVMLAATADEIAGLTLDLGALLGDTALREVLAGGGSVIPDDGANPGRQPAPPVPPDVALMLLADSLLGGTPYNLVFTLCFPDRVEGDRLEEAVRVLVAANPMLRTRFRSHDGAFVPELLPPSAVAIERRSVVGMVEVAGAAVQELARIEGAVPLDARARPPLRVIWCACAGADRDAVIVVVHHALVDGHGIGRLLAGLVAAYDVAGEDGAPAPAPAPAPELKGREEPGTSRELLAAWWAGHLSQVPHVLELPTSRARADLQDVRGARLPFSLDAEETRQLRDLARRHGVTPFVVWLTAWGLTLARHCGVKRLLVGVPYLGRPTAGARDSIDARSSVLPVLVDVDEEADLGAHLRSLRSSLTASLSHAGLPFSNLLDAVRPEKDGRRNPLIQHVLGAHSDLVPPAFETRAGWVRVVEGHGGGSPFDASIFVQRDAPVLTGALEYATAAMTPGEACELLASFCALLSELAAASDEITIGDLRGVPGCARRELTALERPVANPAQSSIERLVHQRATLAPASPAVLRRDPTAPDSVRAADQAWSVVTYEQLWRASEHQAAALHSAGVRPGDTVAVALGRGLPEIVAVLGALRAGAAYAPLDQTWPVARLLACVERCRPVAMLADDPEMAVLASCVSAPALAEEWLTAPSNPPSWPEDQPGRTAYVTFTSGTSGNPKAVAVPHRAVTRLCADDGVTDVSAGDTVLRYAPLAFDASTLEIFPPLTRGACIAIAPRDPLSLPELSETISTAGVSVAWLTAGLFRVLVDTLPEVFAPLRHLLTGGEVVPADRVARVVALHPNLRVTNGYGPTENTTFSTVAIFEPGDVIPDPLPLGRPVRGTGVAVLDSRGRLLPKGARGEICLTGDGLALGYLRDGGPGAAAGGEAFERRSPLLGLPMYRTGDAGRVAIDGSIEYLGRLDGEAKIRGFRVNPTSVANVLRSAKGVSEVTVVAVGAPGRRELVALVRPVPGTAPGAAIDEARSRAARLLPAFERPSRWGEMEEVPVTANGKLDLDAVARLVTSRPRVPFVGDSASGEPVTAGVAERVAAGVPAASSDVAALVQGIVARTLGASEVAADDDLFDLGADSLLLARLVVLVETGTGVRVPLRQLYRSPTLRTLVALVEEGAPA